MATTEIPSTPQAPDAPQAPKRPNVVRNAGIVSLAVMASRVLGLVREQFFAIFFGAGFQYDAFLVAFKIPNLLRDLFAEGALSSAFVTTFSQVQEKQGEKEALRLANLVANALIIILLVISVLGWIFTPEIVRLIAPGYFAVPGKAELTITLTRIMIPFLLLVALAAQAMGVLNARNRFGVPAIAAAFFNIGAILGGVLVGFLLGPYIGVSRIAGMAYGTVIGGALQFLVQWPSLRKVGYRYRPLLSFSDPGVRQIMRLMGPAIIGTAAVQVNVMINNIFASSITDPITGQVINGPVSWINYSFRFMQFPIGVFGVAIATVTLPAISRSVARNDMSEFRHTLAHSLSLVFLLCIPSALGLIVLGEPIIGMIYEHGRFTQVDTIMTARALAAFALGLSGYAAIKVLSPAFYAMNDARTPMIISLSMIALNYTMNSLLVGPFGHVGLALSTSGVALANFLLLMIFMRRKIGRMEGRYLTLTLLKICLASALMAGAAWLVNWQLATHLRLGQFVQDLIQVGAAMAVALVVFYAACRLLKVQEFDEAVDAVAGRILRRLRRTKS